MSALPDQRPSSPAESSDDDASALPRPRALAREDVSPDTLLAYMSAGMALVKAHRSHGHLKAHLDPLGSEPPGDPALEPEYLGLSEEAMALLPAEPLRVYTPGQTLAEILPQLREIYCGAIAYEFEHLSSHEQRIWLRDAVESRRYWVEAPPEEARHLLLRLLRIEGLEQYVKRTYLGAKSFSIEGLDVMILMLDEAVMLAAQEGIRDCTFGMAHRGRLNVLAHVLHLPYRQILAEFEGEHTSDIATLTPRGGTGDVKYHYGATTTRAIRLPDGSTREVMLELVPNPSHLEFVNPVVMGRVRGLQSERVAPAHVGHDPSASMAVLIHGDAAFSGQGIVPECFNLQNLDGYRIGGTLHIISNNQIGFTTDTQDSRSTRYASDMAKGYNVPIVHVNADDLDACRAAIRLAMAFRARFKKDVVIDLVGYRRWGHNEGDEPAYTQPLMTERIKAHPSIATIYGERLMEAGIIARADIDEMEAGIRHRLDEAHDTMERRPSRAMAGGPPVEVVEMDTSVPRDVLERLNDELLAVPEGFSPHPKLWQQIERRRLPFTEAGGRLDWGHAETLAYATLLAQGTSIRLSGQDSERGTFAHRHAVLHDVETGRTWTPLMELEDAKGFFEVRNSPLTENATLGYEYGFAATRPDDLVLWEAQFGDFVNGAQVIIDQFIMAGRSKWGQESRLVLLLPHGYEGNGPEHSSARLERFLKAAAEDNCTIAYPTTPAQMFHLVRTQALRTERRPLIVMTPKSLLRLKDAASPLEALTDGGFQSVIDDDDVAEYREDVSRLILCSGKVYWDIQRHAARRQVDDVAVVRIERLYPFPTERLRAIVSQYSGLESVVWCQEEPLNMGAWRSIRHRLEMVMPGMVTTYVGRPWRASPSEGYPPAHQAEQDRIVRTALGVD